MIIELGNHAPKQAGPDGPKITSIHIPEADSSGLGGYTHEIGGVAADDLKTHLVDAVATRSGLTRLPGHEILLSILHPTEGAWAKHGADKPAWVQVTANADTPEGRAADVEQFLSEYWKTPTAQEFFAAVDEVELAVKKGLAYWDRFGAPGQLPPAPTLPDATALYTNSGRVISNVNDGGGQVGSTGTGSAAGATSLTTNQTYTLNQWAGYRVYAMQTATGPIVWANVVSNTAGSNSVLTVDRWYTAATPGGAAASYPSAGYYYVIADGGATSCWFVGLATGANAPAATDTSLSTNGNAEITTGGGGLIRKIAPYAQTSGTSPRSITLTPVYTANGSDSLPATVTTIGVFNSMVVGTAGTMKFETALSASATLSASGDQLTVTETITGS